MRLSALVGSFGMNAVQQRADFLRPGAPAHRPSATHGASSVGPTCLSRLHVRSNRLRLLRREVFHEVMLIFVRAHSIGERFELLNRIVLALCGEYRKFWRRADAARPVATGAKIHRLFFSRLLCVWR